MFAKKFKVFFYVYFSINCITLCIEFPIKTFLNVPDNLYKREDQYLCNSTNHNDKCCECEEDCMRYKTCCIDKLWNENDTNLNDYLQRFERTSSQYKTTHCESVYPLAYNFSHSSSNYFMVTTCLPNALQSDIDSCQNIGGKSTYEFLIPVFGDDLYLYRNVFCARCNFVTSFTIVPIKANCLSQNRRKKRETVTTTQQPSKSATQATTIETLPTFIITDILTAPPPPEIPPEIIPQTAPPPPPSFTELPPELIPQTAPPPPPPSFTELPPELIPQTAPPPPPPSFTELPPELIPQTAPPPPPPSLTELPPEPNPGTPTTVGQRFSDCNFVIEESFRATYNKYIRTCQPQFLPAKTRCQQSSNNTDYCHMYQGIMQNYANYHCYLCETGNYQSEPYFQCPLPIFPQIRFTWSFTIQFSQSTTDIGITGPASPTTESYCANGELYNVLTGACETFTCSIGYIKVGTNCVKDNMVTITITKSILPNPNYDRCFFLINRTIVIDFGTHIVNETALNTYFKDTLNISETIAWRSSNFSVTILIGNLTVTLQSFAAFENHLTQSDANIWNFIDQVYVLLHPVITDLLKFSPKSLFPNNRFCVSPKVYIDTSIEFSTTCNITVNNVTIKHENYTQWVIFSRSNTNRMLSTCQSFYLHQNCPLSVATNYTIDTNKTLITEARNFTTSEYTPLVNGVGVCLATPSVTNTQYEWQEIVNKVELYISYVGAGVSILCYTILIITYIYFKELHNIPGYILIALCTDLLLSDVLYLIATQVYENYDSCRIVGILLHWALLSVQTWIIVMAFDFLSKFGSQFKDGATFGLRRFSLYFLFNVSIPTTIVTMAVLLDQSKIYEIGYGKFNICFIYFLYPKLFFYIIPFTLTLIVSITSFVKTIYFIRKQELQARSVIQDSNRKQTNLLTVTVKLMFVLGLVELGGFIQIYNPDTEKEEIFNATFRLLFVILRSFRGLILFLIYMVNNQKYRLFKGLFAERWKKLSWSQQTHSASSEGMPQSTWYS